MKVLLIGGSGILSSEISYNLTSNGHQVFMLNRGYRKKLIDEKAYLYMADIRNESSDEIRKKINSEVYDVVIDFISFRVEHLEKVLNFTKGLYKQFIFISSATVYASTQEAIREEFELKNDDWTYSRDKIECEKFLKRYFEFEKNYYTIIRPYVTYGQTRFPFAMLPAENWSLAYRVINKLPIIMWENGESICTLTHSTEFAKGVVGLCLNEHAYNESFHITSQYHYTWNEVLDITAKALQVEPIVVNIPSDFLKQKLPRYAYEVIGDKGRTMIFDNTKISNAVDGFECKIDLCTGIQDTINYYSKYEDEKKINYSWLGDMDWIISQYKKENKGIYNTSNRNTPFKDLMKAGLKNVAKYVVHRYTLCRKLFKV